MQPVAATFQPVEGKKVSLGKERNDHVEIYYEVYGSGPDKVVLIMGLATPCNAWHRTLATLMPQLPNHQFLIFDNRGVGHSSAGTQRCTYELSSSFNDPCAWHIDPCQTRAMAYDLLELLRVLDWHEVHVVGLSMGGMIAQEFVFAYGFKRVRSLALVVTAAQVVYPTLFGYYNMTRSIFLPRPEDRVSFVMPILYSPEFLARKVGDNVMYDILAEDWIARTKKAGPPSNLFGQMSAISTHRVDDARLRQMRASGVPIVMLCAGDDHLVRAHHSHRMGAILKPAEFIEFKGSGHMVHIECMAEFNAALIRNFARAPPASL